MLKLRFKNNNHNAVWLVEPKVTIGAAVDSNLTLAGRGIAANHAEILVNLNDLTLRNLANGKNVWLNGAPVEADARLKVADHLRIGSVELQVVDPKSEKKDGTPTVTRAEPSTGWALKANHSALANRVFPIKATSVVGRSSDCDITLSASHLSRHHAKMIVKDGQLYIKDLDSSNGTYLNGKKVAEAKVKRGDEVRFDTLCFGVIGPANDMDKTSVRSVKRSPAGSSVRPAQRSAGMKSESAAKPQPVDHVSNDDDFHSGGSGLIITAIVLICAAVAVFYMDGL